MENATDALKIAFAVIVLTTALGLAITMFSQVNEVSQIVLKSSDYTTYYSYSEDAAELTQSRIVGLETIIPTLYKYYKENYTVLFLDTDGKPLPLYDSQTNRDLWASWKTPSGEQLNIGIIGKYYTENSNNYKNLDSKPVCAFDVDEETLRHEPWTGNSLDYKINIDKFLNGDVFKYPSGAGEYNYKSSYNSNKGFINCYSGRQFKETLGEYTYNLTEDDDNKNALLKEKKKRVIIYQLQPN